MLVQEQRLKMNHQLLQSIKMMEMPIMDLREKIEDEIEKNPALDVLEDRSLVSLEEVIKTAKEEEEFFDTSSDPGFLGRFTGKSGAEAADEKHRFIEGVISRPETLQEHLLWQLRLECSRPEIRRIGELLIQNLDSNGFHIVAPENLFKNEDLKLIKEAVKFIQSLDPQGCCTEDYRESLQVQAGLLPDAPDGLALALGCLPLLEKGKFAEAAKKTGCTEDEVLYLFERIKDLSPFPGRTYSSANAPAYSAEEIRFVVPDIQVIRKESEFAIILNSEEIPVLGISPFFMKISGEEDKTARDFARENIKEARWFIQAINDRNHTLLRITRALVEFQRAFFSNGPRFLAPLTQKDIAGELGISESTVSRTANGKYVQTEWGIFELRHFFSNSISGTGSGGSKYSKEGVKEILRELITGEGRNCTDQEIADMLARQGIPLARRTIAKYRKEMDFGSSFSR
jgi:RNA polymerase sigma-54 factor